MLRFALLGCGRIGRMHADNIAAHPKAQLAWTYDVHRPSAEEVAERHGAMVAAPSTRRCSTRRSTPS